MSIYDYSVKDRNGNDISMEKFKGKVLLIVNTATGCGFTPQYEGLENLYKKYHEKGLMVKMNYHYILFLKKKKVE